MARSTAADSFAGRMGHTFAARPVGRGSCNGETPVPYFTLSGNDPTSRGTGRAVRPRGETYRGFRDVATENHIEATP
jgi:hypothetical protein